MDANERELEWSVAKTAPAGPRWVLGFFISTIGTIEGGEKSFSESSLMLQRKVESIQPDEIFQIQESSVPLQSLLLQVNSFIGRSALSIFSSREVTVDTLAEWTLRLANNSDGIITTPNPSVYKVAFRPDIVNTSGLWMPPNI